MKHCGQRSTYYHITIHISIFQAQFIAQSIGQAFQVAYMEFLKANGIEDHSFVKEMDYQEVLNSQEIFGDELAMFARKELQKEVCMSSYTIKENITNVKSKKSQICKYGCIF